MRDAKSYCAVLFDDNNRKPVCRFYFNSSKKKSIGIFNTSRQEERIYITELDDIYKIVDKLQNAVMAYLESKTGAQESAVVG